MEFLYLRLFRLMEVLVQSGHTCTIWKSSIYEVDDLLHKRKKITGLVIGVADFSYFTTIQGRTFDVGGEKP